MTNRVLIAGSGPLAHTVIDKIRLHEEFGFRVVGMLAAGDTPETLLDAYPWLKPEDIQEVLSKFK